MQKVFDFLKWAKMMTCITAESYSSRKYIKPLKFIKFD